MYSDLHTGIGSAILTVAAITITLWRWVSKHSKHWVSKHRAARFGRRG